LLEAIKADTNGTRFNRDAQYWIRATISEAYTGLGDETKSQEHMQAALALDPAQLMIDTTNDQLTTLRGLLSNPPSGLT
jgi:hypothetical protein